MMVRWMWGCFSSGCFWVILVTLIGAAAILGVIGHG